MARGPAERRAYDWHGKLAEGKAGADALARWLQANGHTVVDVQDDPDYQTLDTDFLVDGTTVEVKTERRARSNLYLEWEGLHKSAARYWFFYVPAKHIAFCFPREQLVAWLEANRAHLGCRLAWTRHGTRNWAVHGYPVPMRRLYRELPCRIYHITEKEQAA